jgi:nucleoside-diphosphate-sugar epimerase
LFRRIANRSNNDDGKVAYLKIQLIGKTDGLGGQVQSLLSGWGHEVAYGSFSAEVAPEVVVALPSVDLNSILPLLQLPSLKRVVYCGSIQIYRAYARYTKSEPGPLDLVPLLEDDPQQTTGDAAKNEEFVRNECKAMLSVLRLPIMFGPYTANETVTRYLAQMDSGAHELRISASFAEWRCAAAFVDDVALAIALTAKNSKADGKTYNVADSFVFTRLDWIQAIGRAADWDGDVIVEEGEPVDDQVDYSQHLILDSSRIRQDLGYTESIPINDALRRTVKWMRLNPNTKQPPPSRS